MFDHSSLIALLGLIAIGAPVALVLALGVCSLIDRRLSESAVSKLCQSTIVVGLIATLGVLALMLLHGTRHESIEVGEWVTIPHYHFSIKFVFDRLSVPLAILSFTLCGTIAAFGVRYLHREQGFNRFFVLYALFVLGMVVTSLAGTIETLFAGWELVGLSSVFLIAFYQERPVPAQNGFRVWVVYRISDAALLMAAIVLHHVQGEGDFVKLLGSAPWPEGHALLHPEGGSEPAMTSHLIGAGWEPLLVGGLLLIAAAGKSALAPFSGWLPRAMEGPTPSSAVFYGALSVHLGAFLLLRISPILEQSVWLSAAVVALGLVTALYAYLAGSVQTDIKSALCFASLAQVGLIVAETGLGWHYIPLIHLLGNACLRTLQFIRAPALLQDYSALENAIGQRLPPGTAPLGHAGGGFRTWVYRVALERGCLDSLMVNYFVAPFVRLFRWCDSLERRWTDFLSGGRSRESDQLKPDAGALSELP